MTPTLRSYAYAKIAGRKAHQQLSSITTSIFGLVAQGYSAAATAYLNAAAIYLAVDGEPDTAADTSDMPGRIVFYTTPDGANALAERARINNAGYFGIGTTDPQTTPAPEQHLGHYPAAGRNQE